MEIQLGSKVRDKITGFTGTAVAKTVFLNGCIQYIVLSKFNKKEPPLEMNIDEQTLEIIKPVAKKKKKKESNGGRSTSGFKRRFY